MSEARATDRQRIAAACPVSTLLIDALADPKHPDHADAMEWASDYDPAQIDEETITCALLRIARRRNAAKGRKDKTD